MPDDKVPWSVLWPEYVPVVYTAPGVLKQPVWADDPKKVEDYAWNELDGRIDRTSFEGSYALDAQFGVPL